MSLTGGFNANYGTASVGTSAAVISAAKGRRSIIVQNVHASQILYVGDDDQVTASNGLRVSSGASLTLEGFTGVLYGIASGASTDVRYFEVA